MPLGKGVDCRLQLVAVDSRASSGGWPGESAASLTKGDGVDIGAGNGIFFNKINQTSSNLKSTDDDTVHARHFPFGPSVRIFRGCEEDSAVQQAGNRKRRWPRMQVLPRHDQHLPGRRECIHRALQWVLPKPR